MLGRRRRILSTLEGIACLCLVGTLASAVMGEDLVPNNTARPEAKGAKIARDIGKTVHIEPPTKAIVATKSANVPIADNPKVQPGLVRWHKDFNEACAAAKKSGKPVLLFQMMGKLDDQFC